MDVALGKDSVFVKWDTFCSPCCIKRPNTKGETNVKHHIQTQTVSWVIRIRTIHTWSIHCTVTFWMAVYQLLVHGWLTTLLTSVRILAHFLIFLTIRIVRVVCSTFSLSYALVPIPLLLSYYILVPICSSSLLGNRSLNGRRNRNLAAPQVRVDQRTTDRARVLNSACWQNQKGTIWDTRKMIYIHFCTVYFCNIC